MDRNQALWSLTVFFGATLVYGLIRKATEGQSWGLTLGLQVAALVVMIAGIVIFMRTRGDK